MFERPLTPRQAWAHVAGWLASPVAWVPDGDEATARILGELLTDDVGGNLVPDAQLAALALRHGLAVVTFDHDFRRFTDVRVVEPE